MAFRVAACIEMLLAIIFACVLDDEFRTSAFGAPIERVRINDQKRADVRFISATLIRLLQPFVKDRSIDGSERNCGMAVGQLSASDGAIFVADCQVLLETQCRTKPIDRGWHITVSYYRSDTCLVGRHGRERSQSIKGLHPKAILRQRLSVNAAVRLTIG